MARVEQSKLSTPATLDDFLRAFTKGQEAIVIQISQERRAFGKILVVSVTVLSLVGLFLASLGLLVFQRLFGRRGLVTRMVDVFERGALPAPEAGNPALGLDNPALLPPPTGATRKVEIIEAEMVHVGDTTMAENLLFPLLEDDDPWVRARAAKALYPIQHDPAMGALQSLIRHKKKNVRMAGVWALGEVAQPDAVEGLKSLVSDSDREIARAAIHCLMQIQDRKQAPPQVLERVKAALRELQEKREWVI